MHPSAPLQNAGPFFCAAGAKGFRKKAARILADRGLIPRISFLKFRLAPARGWSGDRPLRVIRPGTRREARRRSAMRIRFARADDVALLLQLIRELASYER